MVDYVRSIRSNHSTLARFFSTSDMNKLRKIRRRHWEVRLNISKLAKFESDCLRERRYSEAKLRKFKDVCMGRGGGGVCTIQRLLNFTTLRSCTYLR